MLSLFCSISLKKKKRWLWQWVNLGPSVGQDPQVEKHWYRLRCKGKRLAKTGRPDGLLGEFKGFAECLLISFWTCSCVPRDQRTRKEICCTLTRNQTSVNILKLKRQVSLLKTRWGHGLSARRVLLQELGQEANPTHAAPWLKGSVLRASLVCGVVTNIMHLKKSKKQIRRKKDGFSESEPETAVTMGGPTRSNGEIPSGKHKVRYHRSSRSSPPPGEEVLVTLASDYFRYYPLFR